MNEGNVGKEVKMERRRVSRIDIIVGAVAVGIGLVLVMLFFLLRKPGGHVIVSIDGREVASYALSDTVDVIVQDLARESSNTPDNSGESGNHDVSVHTGRNRLVIRDGEARIEEADCPDKLCVHQGGISHTNESIVCLPHRVSIRIAGESEETAPDAVAK